MVKLFISVNENLVFSLWDRQDQCPADEVMVVLELSGNQSAKLGMAGIMAKAKVEKEARLKEVRNVG
jgi:hypothetical protein